MFFLIYIFILAVSPSLKSRASYDMTALQFEPFPINTPILWPRIEYCDRILSNGFTLST